MTQQSLDELEREVECARLKLANDLSTLRDPEAYSRLKDDLRHEALEAKDALVEKAKSTTLSSAQSLLEEIKARAAANPAAALAIGAGVAWRLIQHPPVATALIGTGLYSLLRTTPIPADARDRVDYLSHAKERLTEQAGQMAEAAKEQAAQLAGVAKEQAAQLAGSAKAQAAQLADAARVQATEMAEAVKARASGVADTVTGKIQEWSEEAKSAVLHATQSSGAGAFLDRASDVIDHTGQKVADMAATATSVAERASWTVQDRLSDQEVRDKILLGAAGLAVAAALGIAYQRKRLGEPAQG